ncbi:MAG: hypothetical protein A2712_01935 [Deltaproteobacteria bacterium RIFCSPHIGHO2_01_FULL_43_49]|nr:MAG: hypothetical protein A2712_01935 [Deltaproteobacteria bacterium RIFCSPHIGHO2_01_FULL_43_49]OGQ27266.1 MAG: hypothetical protein A3D98_02530 [Deltaproteobacteria bacterium RIFCSPHIGHO2_12_FULL_44_21]
MVRLTLLPSYQIDLGTATDFKSPIRSCSSQWRTTGKNNAPYYRGVCQQPPAVVFRLDFPRFG